MYWAWETTAMLRLLGCAPSGGAPTQGRRGAGAYRVATRTACLSGVEFPVDCLPQIHNMKSELH